MIDYYAELGLRPDVEPEAIEGAYKRLIFKYHPDRGGDEERAKRITAAYYVLSDPKRRREYDAQARLDSGYTATEDISSEVIDAIIAAQFVGAAAATARTVGRVAGRAAMTTAVVGVQAVSYHVEQSKRRSAVRRRQDAVRMESYYADRARKQIEDSSRLWFSSTCESAGLELLRGQLTQESFKLLKPDDFLWLWLKHPDRAVRRWAKTWVDFHTSESIKPACFCLACGQMRWLDGGGRCPMGHSASKMTRAEFVSVGRGGVRDVGCAARLLVWFERAVAAGLIMVLIVVSRLPEYTEQMYFLVPVALIVYLIARAWRWRVVSKRVRVCTVHWQDMGNGQQDSAVVYWNGSILSTSAGAAVLSRFIERQDRVGLVEWKSTRMKRRFEREMSL